MKKSQRPPKRTISKMITDVSPYELEGSLETVKMRIEEWIGMHGKDARLDWDPYFQHAYDPSPSPRFELKIDREETDEEYADRMAKDAAAAEKQKERDLKELARLEKLYKGK